MRTPPLLADFSHARACKPFCENSLTLPDEEIMESCSCGKYQYGDEVKLPNSAWQYVKEGFMGTVYKCSRCGCLWFKTISSGIIGMPIYIKSKPDADFGKPSPASDVRLEDLLVKK